MEEDKTLGLTADQVKVVRPISNVMLVCRHALVALATYDLLLAPNTASEAKMAKNFNFYSYQINQALQGELR